jgi:hypothetical protein
VAEPLYTGYYQKRPENLRYCVFVAQAEKDRGELGSHCQTLTAFSTTTGQYCTAIFVSHTSAETVSAFAFDFARLEGTLHDFYSVIWPKMAFSKRRPFYVALIFMSIDKYVFFYMPIKFFF